MGTWLATIRLPGAVRYADYSTVVDAVCRPLYPSRHESYGRNRASGEPLPEFPDRPLAPVGDLILVTVEREPDGDSWHALYCPDRAQLIGPVTDHYGYRLQDDYELVQGHLRRWADPHAECGVPLDARPGEAPPPDLFAQWTDPDLCRRCLLTWLTRPEENRRRDADVPESVPRHRWWRFGR
ncbi:hypothetical protein [Actinoplanes derwentensis]|uniref:hypothetical protein n=1 Tax=Actinoplanes derwentensis TaxID=113562 RepID=UPI000B858A45|nr:hypothetical protein [Actinoplanes derwentensis]